MWTYGFEPETADHYLLRCKLNTDLRLDLLIDVYIYIYIYYQPIFKKFSEEKLLNVFPFGSKTFTLDINANILRCTTEFLIATKHVNSLFFSYLKFHVQSLLRALHVSMKFCVLLTSVLLMLFCFFFCILSKYL